MKTEPATPLPECHEGPEAFARFDNEVKFLLSVPHSTIARRARAYKKKSLKNPNRPGPKPKINPST
jgi:hypothetical protein